MMEKVVLGLGSNVGDRPGNIKKALKLISLSQNFDILAVSPVYETEPWGFKNQKKFINCAVICLCRSRPPGLLEELFMIEKKAGRKSRKRWMPREIDIDVLFYGNRKFRGKNLIIPHSRIQHRNFVLKPLTDLIPEFIHPVLKKTISHLYRHSKDTCRVKLFKYQLLR
jgi:2-amino-4-hydroxy-6-hydroxymethyldihydropteridine diphosphokinase